MCIPPPAQGGRYGDVVESAAHVFGGERGGDFPTVAVHADGSRGKGGGGLGYHVPLSFRYLWGYHVPLSFRYLHVWHAVRNAVQLSGSFTQYLKIKANERMNTC